MEMDRLNFVNKHIQLAIKVAHTGLHDQYRVGSVLINKGNVASVGANNHKTHPISGFKTTHSEIQAIIGVRWSDISGPIIFVARININGKVGMAKPCLSCQKVLREYGVRKAYFTTAASIEELRLS
jgi:cytidine deaminase